MLVDANCRHAECKPIGSGIATGRIVKSYIPSQNQSLEIILCTNCSPSPHFSHYCTDSDATQGNGVGCPASLSLLMHYLADLQLVQGHRCYDNIAPNAKCRRVIVLARWLLALVACD